MNKTKLTVTDCYGAIFKENGIVIKGIPDSFIAFFNENPVIATKYSYRYSEQGYSGKCDRYKFINLDTLQEIDIKDGIEIELDTYYMEVTRGD